MADKRAAHDRWVCLSCRFTCKRMRLDVRVANRPSALCPRCRVKMTFAGNAFRPPRKDDEDAWATAIELLSRGVRYPQTRDRRAMPRAVDEIEPWLAAHKPRWLDEKALVIELDRVKVGRRTLESYEPVLVLVDGRWRKGTFVTLGFARRRLHTPVVTLEGRPSIAVTPQLRLRVAARSAH